ncbi:Phosphatidylglycerophosphatase B [Enhygromyxa salina]|uniref:Phosphatidylglycerophosphatase B n=1 Tax=Enhygromyxa salina TaxID=215803 RepID=A0A2S9XCF4_9BACT|nr:Phosphatidylglycerophosphatase B [Enhygromyxa salina]
MLIPIYVLVLMSFVLPEIALDSSFAELVVRLTDSSTWQQLPLLCAAGVIVLVSRPGLSARRRAVEGVVVFVAMGLGLAGVAQFNEHVLKPAVHAPRPNIVTLADAGALGPEVPDADAFYELGDKDVRRELLREQLPELDEPALAPLVREHWIEETGYTFPSGHATASMTFATMMLALGLCWLGGWRQRITTALPVWALCVAYSRPLLRVHRPLDVSVGALVGMGLGLLCFVVIRWLVERITDEGARATESVTGAPS